MSNQQPFPYGSDSSAEMMHVASASETTGSIPTPPISAAAAQSYAQVTDTPQDMNSTAGPVYAYVNPDTCIGCGVCVGMCPDVFELGDDSLAHAISGPVPPSLTADAESARFACPVSAIDVKTEDA